MVGGINQWDSTRAMAVVNVGSVWSQKMPFKGHSEAPQSTYVGSPWAAGASSGCPLSSLQRIRTSHCLEGLQQEKCTVLALSCSMQKRKQKYQLTRSTAWWLYASALK